MRPARWVFILTTSLVTATALVRESLAADRPAPSRAGKGQTLEIALHYDFFLTDGSKINDASGKKHHGLMVRGSILEGRRRNAVELNGDGMIRVTGAADTLDPTGRALTVGAVCQPSKPDGVIAAMGDTRDGFSLYLKDGIPHFAVRRMGRLTKIADTEPIPLDQWAHLVGGIDPDGSIWLIVNGSPTAHARAGRLTRAPVEPFCVGADPGSPVGDYGSPLHWHGLLQEVRLYWGFIDLKTDREEMKDWADLSGCGCK